MKKFLTIIAFFLTANVFAQSADDVANALKAGDANKFSSYFSNAVNISLPQKPEVKNLSKADAAVMIKNFFSQNKVSGFERFSDSRQLNDMTYVAGKLKGAQEYNITVVVKSTGNTTSVIRVRIF
ncbi:DUF4783 domain-containing protein [Parafilimonas sp.]|uniref:DUF4783 domain-containing protein n=1 Tax=Parafilimonas sp. TaxID=1969739 RepID=UPI0039E36B2B